MNYIDKMIEKLEDEVEGAVEYAEESIKCRAKGHTERASKYRAMALDEITHAETIRDFTTQDIADIKRVYEIPVEDEEKWHSAHRRINEIIAAIKLMIG